MDVILRRRAIRSGATDLFHSLKPDKKYTVIYNNKAIDFGDSRYQDYLIHGDRKRRKRYRARAEGIQNKSIVVTYPV